MTLGIGLLFWGMTLGFIIGAQYIPHQIKKKNPRMVAKVRRWLEEAGE